MEYCRRDGRHLRVLENFVALQTGQHRWCHETHPCHVFRPFERLDMWRHLYRNADTLEDVPQGLDTWGRTFGQLTQVASLIRPETDRTHQEHFRTEMRHGTEDLVPPKCLG